MISTIQSFQLNLMRNEELLNPNKLKKRFAQHVMAHALMKLLEMLELEENQ